MSTKKATPNNEVNIHVPMRNLRARRVRESVATVQTLTSIALRTGLTSDSKAAEDAAYDLVKEANVFVTSALDSLSTLKELQSSTNPSKG